MAINRPGIALDSRSFGRGPDRQLPMTAIQAPISADLKLFATTFLAGFVFVSMLLA